MAERVGTERQRVTPQPRSLSAAHTAKPCSTRRRNPQQHCLASRHPAAAPGSWLQQRGSESPWCRAGLKNGCQRDALLSALVWCRESQCLPACVRPASIPRYSRTGGVCAACSGVYGEQRWEDGRRYLLVQRTLSSGLGFEASLGKGIPRECPHRGDCDREAWLRVHSPARGTARKHRGVCLEMANCSHAQVARAHADQLTEDCGSSGRKWQGHFVFEHFQESFHSRQQCVSEIQLWTGPVVVLHFTRRSSLRGWEAASSAMSWPQKLCPGSTANVCRLPVHSTRPKVSQKESKAKHPSGTIRPSTLLRASSALALRCLQIWARPFSRPISSIIPAGSCRQPSSPLLWACHGGDKEWEFPAVLFCPVISVCMLVVTLL